LVWSAASEKVILAHYFAWSYQKKNKNAVSKKSKRDGLARFCRRSHSAV
jgi:hypothetical protein